MRRLMVIDDEPAFAAFVSRVAATAGFDAVAPPTPAAALEAMEPGPAVVILDLQMPGIDGIELLRAFSNADCRSRIVLVSGLDGRTMDAACRLGKQLGLDMAGTMQKPVRAGELRALLERLGTDRNGVTVDGLAEAIERDDLFLLYQPKIEVATGRIVGAEALVRWRRRDGEIVGPAGFIALAEQNGLINALTGRVVEHALRQAGQWHRRGLPLSVAINLSPRNIPDRNLPDLLAARCRETGAVPELVTLELTETASMRDTATTLEVLGRFRIKGFRLSIDDFGTGYSSIAQLLRLPFSELKVDRSFVMDIATSNDCAVITRTIIDMAHNLGLTAVAEGVEDEDILALLRRYRCDVAQGFHFSPPVPADRLEALLAAQVAEAGGAECPPS